MCFLNMCENIKKYLYETDGVYTNLDSIKCRKLVGNCSWLI